jgi:hypothetical protein
MVDEVDRFAEHDYDFDIGDLGIEIDFPKTELHNKVIRVWGVSESTINTIDAPEPAKSLLWNWPSEPRSMPHWGLLLSQTSLPIVDAKTKMERGEVPFLAVILFLPKVNTKNQNYWVLKRYLKAYDAQGNELEPNSPEAMKLREASLNAKNGGKK